MASFAFITASAPLRTSSWLSASSAVTTRRPVVRGPRMTAIPPGSGKPMSKALPFMEKPEGLDDSLPGYAGFDPFGFCANIDQRWMVEGEVKNGRAACLGCLGILVQEFIHLPNSNYQNPLPAGAWADVPTVALWQIFIFCGLFELASYGGNVTYDLMLPFFDKHPEREGGTFGLDFLNVLGGSAAKTEKAKQLRTVEIKFGRLAMIAVGGMIVQTMLFKQPIVYNLLHFQPERIFAP